jgi:serine/threonine protein kinase
MPRTRTRRTRSAWYVCRNQGQRLSPILTDWRQNRKVLDIGPSVDPLASDAQVVADRYRLVRELGRGGIGTVWLAEDQQTGRPVAVKELRPLADLTPADRRASARRALREARNALRLRHPNAVALRDVQPSSTDADAVYLIMDLLDGPTLAQVIGSRGPLPATAVAAYGLHLLSVLDAAHALGIVHSDIKPVNIIIAGGQARLTDFGVGDARLTRGGVIGTQAYRAPELFESAPINPAVDLWSLGACLFFAAEGYGPFEHDDVKATVRAIRIDKLPVPSCQGPLATAISSLLQRDPARRATSGRARAYLLQAVQSAAPAALSPASAPPWQNAQLAPQPHPQPAPQRHAKPAPQPRAYLAPQPQAEPAPQPDSQPTPGPGPNIPAGWEQAYAALSPKALAQPRPSRQAPPQLAPPQLAPPQLAPPQLAPPQLAPPQLAPPPPVASPPAASPPGPSQRVRARPMQPSTPSQPQLTAGPLPPSPGSPGHRLRHRLPPTATKVAAAILVAAAVSVPLLVLTGQHQASATKGQHQASPPRTSRVPPASAAHPVLAATLPNPGSDNRPHGLAFSPDGTMLAASSDTGDSTQLWDVATHRIAATLTDPGGGRNTVYSVAFSPDGKMLATGDTDDSTYLWDVASRRIVATLTDPGGGNAAVEAVAFSPDGRTLAVGDYDGSTYLWNVASGQLAGTLTDPHGSGSVDSVAFAPSGQMLAAGDSFGTTYLWDEPAGRLAGTLTGPGSSSPVDSVAFSPGGQTLATGFDQGSTDLWDVATSHVAATMTIPGSPVVNSVAFSLDGTMVAIGSDRTYLWDTTSRRIVATLSDPVSSSGAGNDVGAVAFSPTGSMVAAGDTGGTYLWNIG